MNKNSETRIECTDWDEDVPVATWAKGRRRMPARKVITKGVAKVELTARQAGSIVGKLAAGMEVRLAMGGEEAIRLFPCAATDFRTMFVAAETMGGFRHDAYRGRHLAFTSRRGARRVSRDDVAARAERVRDARRERAQVTPDTMVECPSCGYTFRVGVRQGG